MLEHTNKMKEYPWMDEVNLKAVQRQIRYKLTWTERSTVYQYRKNTGPWRYRVVSARQWRSCYLTSVWHSLDRGYARGRYPQRYHSVLARRHHRQRRANRWWIFRGKPVVLKSLQQAARIGDAAALKVNAQFVTAPRRFRAKTAYITVPGRKPVIAVGIILVARKLPNYTTS